MEKLSDFLTNRGGEWYFRSPWSFSAIVDTRTATPCVSSQGLGFRPVLNPRRRKGPPL